MTTEEMALERRKLPERLPAAVETTLEAIATRLQALEDSAEQRAVTQEQMLAALSDTNLRVETHREAIASLDRIIQSLLMELQPLHHASSLFRALGNLTSKIQQTHAAACVLAELVGLNWLWRQLKKLPVLFRLLLLVGVSGAWWQQDSVLSFLYKAYRILTE